MRSCSKCFTYDSGMMICYISQVEHGEIANGNKSNKMGEMASHVYFSTATI